MAQAMTEPQALRQALCACLRRAVAEIFVAPPEVQAKGQDGLDLVTSLDLAMQARLTADLAALLPGSVVTGEEDYAAADPACRHVWLVDPLDGTVNFVAGLPAYAVAVVLLEAGRPVLAAVHDIAHDRTWSALAGGGAFLDDAPLRPRAHAARLGVLSSGLLADLAARAPGALGQILAGAKLRNLGSQALHLCHAASGHLGFVASREARAWDDLAGALIAQEAGLVYGRYAPGPAPRAEAEQFSLCAPPGQFDTLASLLAASCPPQDRSPAA